eukprot:2444246-Lingulodinium_polyedra.AAC.1
MESFQTEQLPGAIVEAMTQCCSTLQGSNDEVVVFWAQSDPPESAKFYATAWDVLRRSLSKLVSLLLNLLLGAFAGSAEVPRPEGLQKSAVVKVWDAGFNVFLKHPIMKTDAVPDAERHQCSEAA